MLALNLNYNKKNGLNILCIGAHCDDIEIGCGGTILKLLAEYKIRSVYWIVFTSSENRKQEAEVCARQFLHEVSNNEIVVKDYRDGFLPYIGYDVKQIFEDLKAHFDPDLIFTHYRHDLHQDHRLLCELTWNTFRNHLILEYEIPKYDGDIGQPNLFVPLDEDVVTKKNDYILSSFKSQAGKHWFDQDTFKSILRLRGMESASIGGYAEAFYVRKVMLK